MEPTDEIKIRIEINFIIRKLLDLENIFYKLINTKQGRNKMNSLIEDIEYDISALILRYDISEINFNILESIYDENEKLKKSLLNVDNEQIIREHILGHIREICTIKNGVNSYKIIDKEFDNLIYEIYDFFKEIYNEELKSKIDREDIIENIQYIEYRIKNIINLNPLTEKYIAEMEYFYNLINDVRIIFEKNYDIDFGPRPIKSVRSYSKYTRRNFKNI